MKEPGPPPIMAIRTGSLPISRPPHAVVTD
jgi:hypothetical protein